VILGRTDFDIRDGDRIYVRSPSHYLEHHQVLVRGEVLFPGWYAINPREDKLSEVVARAGGLTAEADLSGGRVIRPRSLASGGEGRVQCDMVKLFLEKRAEKDIVLESGDIIEIPARIGYVYVTGEVHRPGYVPYVQNERAGFYVRQAGGFTRKADGGKTLVRRLSTGQSLSRREAGIILPNDSISVPARMEGARWVFVKDTIALLAQMATIYIVIDQATKE
jgi:protein involved in polysaccharide export with SLBB domain